MSARAGFWEWKQFDNSPALHSLPCGARRWPLSVLILVVVATSIHRPGGRTPGSPMSWARPSQAEPTVGRSCWKRVLRDWVDNREIDGKYPARCYELAVNHIPEEGPWLYGGGAELVSSLEEGAVR